MKFNFLLFVLLFVLLSGNLFSNKNTPVVLEAKNAALGSEFRVVDTLGVTCITIASNSINTLNPTSAERVATFQVTFADTGTYDLYARILVGPLNYDDDSYFYAKRFGQVDAATDADWVRANGLAPVGYTDATDVVAGTGEAQWNVWKWLNMSKFAADGTPVQFKVNAGELSQTFKIGGRENGFYIHKIVFAKAGVNFTVDNLDKGVAPVVVDPNANPWNPIAKGKDKFIGCAWARNQSTGFEQLWNQVTPENAGKWGSVERTQNSYSWTDLDASYNLAKKNNMLFKQHTLIWGAQQPAWLANLDSAAQRKEIEEWFSLQAQRYPDMEYVEVVNEPIHNAPNGMLPWGSTVKNINYAPALGGAGATGWDWIITSFRLARQYFPKAKLILNEYSVINSTSTTNKYLEIIRLLQAESLIDGIGEQAHAFTTKGTSNQVMKNNLDALAATGLPIYITEMDIDGLDDLTQLTEMRRVFKLFWEHPAVAGITFWGFRYGLWRTEQGAYLVSQAGADRPALTWLKAYVNDSLVPVQSFNVSSFNGQTRIATKGGTLKMVAVAQPANATIKNVNWSVVPTNVAKIDANGLLTALANGVATITATAWDGSGTKSTGTINIVDQSVDASEIEAGQSISIAPNPSNNGVFVLSGVVDFQQVDAFDMAGKKIATFYNNQEQNMQIQLQAPKGVYFLRMRNNQVYVNKKVIIK